MNTKVPFFLFALFLTLAVCLSAQSARAAEGGFDFTFGQQTFSVDQASLASWEGEQTVEANKIFAPAPMSLQDSLAAFLGQPVAPKNTVLIYHHRLDKIYTYLTGIADQINVASQNPDLEIQDGRATKFTPPQTGSQLDVYQSSLSALRAMEVRKNSTELAVYQTPPQGDLSQTNTLGINELIASGVSNFKGSPNNRRHNIAAGIEKFKGLIIPQGAIFSFDDNLGPVTAEAGFLPELVIDNGTTKPELGGGLCQVSTTTFRAAMSAGLPITARRNHAYAVQYYSPQGTDATIYPGSADLKFVNDTPGAILVWPYEKDTNTLVFDFYGTKDGRQVTLEKPVVYDRTPDGAMKATWTRDVVSADGTTRTDVFKSNYQPPALFHKTEKFVAAVPASAALPATIAPSSPSQTQ